MQGTEQDSNHRTQFGCSKSYTWRDVAVYDSAVCQLSLRAHWTLSMTFMVSCLMSQQKVSLHTTVWHKYTRTARYLPLDIANIPFEEAYEVFLSSVYLGVILPQCCSVPVAPCWSPQSILQNVNRVVTLLQQCYNTPTYLIFWWKC